MAAAGKTMDAPGAKRVIGGPQHAKMPSAAVTEVAKVPPIIYNNKLSNTHTGRESAFSKKLPEIQRVTDEVETKGQYVGQRRFSQQQRIQSASALGVNQKRTSYLGPRILAAQNILK